MTKCRTRQLLFINNNNINLNMLNKSGLHLNEYGTTRLANNFCYSMDAWLYEICTDAQNTTQTEDSPLPKRRNLLNK